MPRLDGAGAQAFLLFSYCQTQWERSQMSGQRLGIPRDRMEVEAERRNIDLNELVLDKFLFCEAEVMHADAIRIKAESETD